MKLVSYEDVRRDPEVLAYIEQGDRSLGVMGFTEHALPHGTITANTAAKILNSLGYDERQVELGRITGFLHDIGNMINRSDHAQSGAIIAMRILQRMGMEPTEIAAIVSAIGNHDEATAVPVHSIAAAVILADKSDVRRSRVRNTKPETFDIHDRVNHAAVRNEVVINMEERCCTLCIDIDTEVSQIFEFFEIFLTRMLLCRKAADSLGLNFGLEINGSKLI